MVRNLLQPLLCSLRMFLVRHVGVSHSVTSFVRCYVTAAILVPVGGSNSAFSLFANLSLLHYVQIVRVILILSAFTIIFITYSGRI